MIFFSNITISFLLVLQLQTSRMTVNENAFLRLQVPVFEMVLSNYKQIG